MSSKIDQEVAALKRIANFHGEKVPELRKVPYGPGAYLKFFFFYEIYGIGYLAENYILACKDAKNKSEIFWIEKSKVVACEALDCLVLERADDSIHHHYYHAWNTWKWRCGGHDLWNELRCIEDMPKQYMDQVKKAGNWYEN